MKVIVEIEVNDTCVKCPHCNHDRTVGAGFALDYFCKKADYREIMGYVEYSNDLKPIPEWCPFINNEKV